MSPSLFPTQEALKDYVYERSTSTPHLITQSDLMTWCVILVYLKRKLKFYLSFRLKGWNLLHSDTRCATSVIVTIICLRQ